MGQRLVNYFTIKIYFLLIGLFWFSKMLSNTEKFIISEGIKNNVRIDGRENLEFRPFMIQTVNKKIK
jgi:hypothetical protein